MKVQQILVLATCALVSATSSWSLAAEREAVLGQLDFAGTELILPMKNQNGHPKVLVDLGDGEEHLFIVDTGASVHVLDAAIAASLGLEVVGETEIGAPGGPQVRSEIVASSPAHIGGATIDGAEFVTMDLDSFSGGTIQGVLGLGLFRDYLLTYDYGQGEIRITRQHLSIGEPDVIPYNDVAGHIQVDMDVAETTIATHVDTGSMAGFTLPYEMKELLSLAPDGQGRAAPRRGLLVDLATLNLDD